MLNRTLTMDPWLITGIFEGDGYTSTSLVIRKNMRITQVRISVGGNNITR